MKEKAQPAIFENEIEPRKETYPQFDITNGPFKNKMDAEKYITAMDCGAACDEG